MRDNGTKVGLLLAAGLLVLAGLWIIQPAPAQQGTGLKRAEWINPRVHYAGRVDLATGAQSQALAQTYNHVSIWLDTGSSDIHVKINARGTTTAAATTDLKLEDGDSMERHMAPGINILYWYATGSTGTVNILAW